MCVCVCVVCVCVVCGVCVVCVCVCVCVCVTHLNPLVDAGGDDSRGIHRLLQSYNIAAGVNNMVLSVVIHQGLKGVEFWSILTDVILPILIIETWGTPTTMMSYSEADHTGHFQSQ